jgi:hypothetical protein
MEDISYFDTTEKLLQNLANGLEKDVDNHFMKESLKTLVTIMKTQNSIIQNLVELEKGFVSTRTADPIIKGMICYIREKKKFGQIINIDKETDKCTLKVLGTDNIVTVSKNQFNI